jgi:GNAT superfamily N-acetyltransferase
MATTIRAAIVGDEGLVAELNRIVQDLHLVRRPDHFKPTQMSELTAWYRSLLDKSTARIWIAEEQGRPVGYVLAILQQLPPTPFTKARRVCEIDQIVVDPEYRRRGIGRALVLKAISEATTEGIQQIEAASWSFNADTHEVLKRLGFVPKTVRFEFEAIS